MKKLCYNCGRELEDQSLELCPNCKIVLNPNDLKWRRSLTLLLFLLCIIPILIVIVLILTS